MHDITSAGRRGSGHPLPRPHLQQPAALRYKGVLHEYLVAPPGERGHVKASGLSIRASRGGARSRNPANITTTWHCLKRTRHRDRSRPLSRYTFYLAQSYRDAGRLNEAAKAICQTAEMGGWDEEAWHARLAEARCLRDLQDEGGFLRQALAAFSQRPHRAEPLYDLARYHRDRGGTRRRRCSRNGGWQSSGRRATPCLSRISSTNGASRRSTRSRPITRTTRRARTAALPLATGSRSIAMSPTRRAAWRDTICASMSSRRRNCFRLSPPGRWASRRPKAGTDESFGGAPRRRDRHGPAHRNFVLEDGNYRTPDDGPVVTRNFLLRLDGRSRSNHRSRSCRPSTCRRLPSGSSWALRICGSSPGRVRSGASRCVRADTRRLAPAELARIDESGAGPYGSSTGGCSSRRGCGGTKRTGCRSSTPATGCALSISAIRRGSSTRMARAVDGSIPPIAPRSSAAAAGDRVRRRVARAGARGRVQRRRQQRAALSSSLCLVRQDLRATRHQLAVHVRAARDRVRRRARLASRRPAPDHLVRRRRRHGVARGSMPTMCARPSRRRTPALRRAGRSGRYSRGRRTLPGGAKFGHTAGKGRAIVIARGGGYGRLRNHLRKPSTKWRWYPRHRQRCTRLQRSDQRPPSKTRRKTRSAPDPGARLLWCGGFEDRSTALRAAGRPACPRRRLSAGLAGHSLRQAEGTASPALPKVHRRTGLSKVCDFSLCAEANNNTDRTEQILREWVERVGPSYAGVEFDADPVAEPVEGRNPRRMSGIRPASACSAKSAM